MQYWEFKDGKWYNGTVESPTPPPPGAAFWFADENGVYQTSTYVDENSTKDLPGVTLTPGVTMDGSKSKGHQTNPGSATAPKAAPTPQVTTPPLAGDNSTGTPPVSEPVPPEITPPAPPAPAKLKDGRIDPIAWNDPEGKPPAGMNPEIWAQRNSWYKQGPMAKTPGGPTDENGVLSQALTPATTAPNANLFNRLDIEGAFTGQEDGSLGNARGETFTRDLLASILEAVRDGKGLGEGGADTVESRRAQAIANSLSGPAPAYNPYQPQGTATNAIDAAGEQFDWEESVQKNKKERAAFKSGDTENMSSRARAAYEKANPPEVPGDDGEGGSTVIGDAVSTDDGRAKKKDKGDNMVDWFKPTRRHADGTLGDMEVDRYAGGVNLDDWMAEPISRAQPGDRRAIDQRKRMAMAGATNKGGAPAGPVRPVGGMNIAPPVSGQGGMRLPQPMPMPNNGGPGLGRDPMAPVIGTAIPAPAPGPGMGRPGQPVQWWKPQDGGGVPHASFR